MKTITHKLKTNLTAFGATFGTLSTISITTAIYVLIAQPEHGKDLIFPCVILGVFTAYLFISSLNEN